MTYENNKKTCVVEQKDKDIVRMWCDDERDVTSMFLKHEPSTENIKNLWKEVNDYLTESKKNAKYDDIKYVEYEYEPLCCNDTYSDSSSSIDNESVDSPNEFLDFVDFKKNNYLYS